MKNNKYRTISKDKKIYDKNTETGKIDMPNTNTQ
jgi:hypothetical protein